VDNTRDSARVSHSRQWSNYNLFLILGLFTFHRHSQDLVSGAGQSWDWILYRPIRRLTLTDRPQKVYHKPHFLYTEYFYGEFRLNQNIGCGFGAWRQKRCLITLY